MVYRIHSVNYGRKKIGSQRQKVFEMPCSMLGLFEMHFSTVWTQHTIVSGRDDCPWHVKATLMAMINFTNLCVIIIIIIIIIP